MSNDLNQIASVQIRPEVTILSVLRHLNYKAWFAMAEFIDNALQSALAHEAELAHIDGTDYRLKIEVKIDPSFPGSITVTDNAAGIATADFPRAFRAAQIPNDRTGLSEFGMGMKSAACWFARDWSVRTTAIGEDVERTVNFDVDSIIENRTEELTPTSRVAPAASHYTVVSLRGLHHIPQTRTIQKIKHHLASIYRMYLRDGRLILKFNDEELSYDSPKTLKAIRYTSAGVPDSNEGAEPVEWKKPIDLNFGKGQRVRGFAALREVGSTPLAGFALFRRDRLIEGSFDDTYRPQEIFKQTNSYPYQRLFGELEIEGFDVSHTKDGFRWEEYEGIFLGFLLEAIEESPLNLIEQAENYRALPSKRNIEKKAEEATNSVAAYVEQEVAPLIVEARENPVTLSPESALTDLPESLQAFERTVEVNDGKYKWAITLRTSLDPTEEDWITVAEDKSGQAQSWKTRKVGVDVSLAHPFSMRYLGANNENVELLLRFGTALAISLILSEDSTGESPGTTLHHLNQLMRGALLKEETNA